MFVHRKLRVLSLSLGLLAGIFTGVPVLPEDIDKLMYAAHQQRVVYTISEREENDENARE